MMMIITILGGIWFFCNANKSRPRNGFVVFNLIWLKDLIPFYPLSLSQVLLVVCRCFVVPAREFECFKVASRLKHITAHKRKDF